MPDPDCMRTGSTLHVNAAHGRPTGRGRPRDPMLHAVPGFDRTRSALCGARVGGAVLPWRWTEAGTCAECATLVGADHALAAGAA